MDQIVLSVSDCVALVNQTLEYAYPSVVVEGEISSFKVSKEKYIFFDIKDQQASMGCFMMAYQLRMPIEDGMKVKIIAQPRLTAWGKFSLNVRSVMPSGQGDLKRSLEMLKAKLTLEGLFDESRKRPLPVLPESVGLIASIESAGYKDFITILNKRWGGLKVQVADVQVQGMVAAEQIMGALQYFNELAEPPEVIILVRGGGSAEDLAVFNEEPLVRAVAASRVPILVGVGHEVDTSLCDLAADVRAATPTNAAQILVPDKRELAQDIEHRQRLMLKNIQHTQNIIWQKINTAQDTLIKHLESRKKDLDHHLKLTTSILLQLNPRTVLNRGYALVRNQKDQILRGPDVKPGDQISIEMASIILKAEVNHVQAK